MLMGGGKEAATDYSFQWAAVQERRKTPDYLLLKVEENLLNCFREMSVSVTDHLHCAWCLLVSTTVLALTVVLTSTTRSLVRAKLTESLSTHCLLDWLCGLELCMCGYELGVVLDIYPFPLPALPVYSAGLWTVLVWQSLAWGDSSPSASSHLVRWSSGGQPASHCLARTMAGTLGALSSYLLMSPLWQLELSQLHEDREVLTSSRKCSEDLQVSVPAGLVVEMTGTLACGLTSLLLSDLPRLRARPRLATALEAAAGVLLVLAGFELTGGYYSPALALGTKLGCGQESLPAHLLVYTLAPCAGALLAAPLHQAAKQMFYPDTKKKIS